MKVNNTRKRRTEATIGSDNEDIQNHQQNNFFDILTPKSFNVIEKFVLKISTEDEQIDLIGREKIKILKVISIWDLEQILDIIKCFTSDSLLIFIIDVKYVGFRTAKQFRSSVDTKIACSNIDQLFADLLSIGKDRPIVLQLTSRTENITKFYYKDEDFQHRKVYGSGFISINLNQKKTEKFLNFPLFLISFLNDDAEDLINTVINNLTGMDNSLLILKFLRAFELNEELLIKLILECAAYCPLNFLKACLDISSEKNDVFTSIPAKAYLTALIGDEPTSVLFAATESNNIEVVDYLTSFCSSFIQQLPFDHQIKVSTCAFSNANFDILCKLLDSSDFPFPEDFNDSHGHEKLFDLTNKRRDFESAILSENVEQMTNYIESNYELKIVYNSSNISSLKQAFDAKKYKSFYHLKSNYFIATEFNSHEDIINEIDEKEFKIAKKHWIQQLKKNISCATVDDEHSINTLCNKSIIHNRNISREEERSYRKKIRIWFQDIHKIKLGKKNLPLGAKMLEIAASCKKLKIIFDFKSETVEDASLANPGSEGVTYPNPNLIFIGAMSIEDRRDQRIKGILAHELCHIIINLIYENNQNPYYKNDENSKQYFKEITKEIDKWSGKKSKEPDDECNEIISSVFRLYTENEFHLELIVRVVHILTQFDDDEGLSNYIQNKYKKLFDFFEMFVYPEMVKFSFEKREIVRKINKSIGLLQKISKQTIHLKNQRNMKAVIERKLIIVNSNVPMLFLYDIYNYLKENLGTLFDALNLFVMPEKFTDLESINKFKWLIDEKYRFKIIVDCSKENYENFMKLAFDNFSSFIFVVTNKCQRNSLINFMLTMKVKYTEVEANYSWNDLSVESQNFFLKTKISFQNNRQISFLDLFTKSINPDEPSTSFSVNEPIKVNFSEIIDNEILNLIIEKSQIIIDTKHKDFENEREFQFLFQPRKFKTDSWDFLEEKFISYVKNFKYVLISDIAGGGKSWALRNIANTLKKNNPTNWILFVDLKQYIKEFKIQNNGINFSKFIIEKVLKLEKKYEANIFQKMYEIGKVFILLDGFDEIAPDCAEFVSNLAKLFEQNDGNQLWITTRHYFKVNLQEKLQISDSCKLDEFKKDNGLKYIVRSWMLNEPDTDHISSKDDFEEFIKNSKKFKYFQELGIKIIKKVSVSDYRTIGMPQIYKIIADAFKDDKEVLMDLSEAKIYKILVEDLYEKWYSGGEIRRKTNKESQGYNLHFWELHQFLAISDLFPRYKEALFFGFDESEWKTEGIVSCGLVNKNGDQYTFIHETFREFFIADFIAKQLKSSRQCKELFDVFVEVMTIEKFELIRMFLNDAITSSVLQKVFPKMHNYINKFQEMQSSKDIFCNFANLANFVIDVLISGGEDGLRDFLVKNLSKILQNLKNEHGFLKVQNLIFAYSNDNFLKKIIIEEAVFLHQIISSLPIECFKEFVTKLETKVNHAIVNEGLKQKIKNENIFFFLCESSNFSFAKFRSVLKIIEKFLSFQEIYELMYSCDRHEAPLLQIILKKSNEPLEYWNEIKTFFYDQNKEISFENLVMKEDSTGSNIFHFIFEININSYKQFFKFIFKIFNKEILKKMFVKLNSSGTSFMHKLMKEDEARIDVIIKIIDFEYGRAVLGKFLIVENKSNLTVFDLIVTREFNNCQLYETIWQALQQACETEKEFLEYLGKKKSMYSKTILQVVAQNDTSNEVLEFMINEMIRLNVSNETKDLLSHQHNKDHILLASFAKKKDNFNLYQKLWKLYFENYSLNDFLNIAKDKCGSKESFLSEIVSHENKELIEFTWNQIKSLKNQDKHEIANYLRTEIWKYDLLKKSSEKGLEEHEYFKNILNGYGLLFETEIYSDFDNEFEKCIQQKNKERLEKLITKYEKLFKIKNNHENFKHFLMTSNSNGRNFLHRSVLCHDIEMFKVLWKRILNITEDCNEMDLFKNQKLISEFGYLMFKEIDLYGGTIMHTCVIHSSEEVFQLLTKIFETVVSKYGIEEVLSNLKTDDNNLLCLAVTENKSIKLYEYVWELFSKYIAPHEINALILNGRKYDPLQLAVRYNTKEIIAKSWDNYKLFLNHNEQLEYLTKNFGSFYRHSFNYNNQKEVHDWLRNITIQFSESIVDVKTTSKNLKKFIKQSLMSMDMNGNIFYYMCKSTDLNHLKIDKHLRALQKYLDIDEILELMQNCDRNGENLFNACVEIGNTDGLVTWITVIRDFFKSENQLNAFHELYQKINLNYRHLCKHSDLNN